MQCRLLRAAALVGIASFCAFSPAKAQTAPNYAGSYAVKGINPGGGVYEGVAAIKRVRGQIYTISWTLADNNEIGTCIGEADRLSCGYRLAGRNSTYTGIIIYNTGTNGKLIGRWVSEKQTGISKENLTPSR